MNAVAYVRVSTEAQGESGAGLAAQESAVRMECLRRGWTLTRVFSDTVSGSGKKPLPGRDEALAVCAETGAALVAAKLDRLTRSAVDFYQLNEQARAHGFPLVCLDVALDTSTAMGEAMAGVVAVFAQLERRRIGERTREALAERRAAGVVLGRPRSIPDELADRIRGLAAAGLDRKEICARLNAERVPTPRGGREWRPSSIEAVLA